MNSDKMLHIISFDNPWPPDYGGVIDVFNRIRMLSESGVRIVLHAFTYGRGPSEELNRYCEQVFYYNRRRWVNPFSQTPYIVSTRRNPDLLQNILADNAPIMFEGLHTCSLLGHRRLQGRTMIVRMHNVEHSYYYFTARNETRLWLKAWFTAESIRLRRYEKILRNATAILAISENDRIDLADRYPNTLLLGPFHGNDKVESRTGTGTYALYHGKLSVAENNRAVMFLASDVFSGTDYPLVIAGSNPRPELRKTVRKSKNIRIIENPSTEELDNLIRDAHINVLPAFQPTGLKLKLINSLCKGRFLVTNSTMVSGTGYESLCHITDDADSLATIIESLREVPFTEAMIEERKLLLSSGHSGQTEIDHLLQII